MPGPESKMFEDFINSIGTPPIPSGDPNAEQESECIIDTRFVSPDSIIPPYSEFEIGTAGFRVEVNTDFLDASMHLYYPSRATTLHEEDLFLSVTSMMDVVDCAGGLTPSVQIKAPEQIHKFDLSDAWQLRKYEKLLELYSGRSGSTILEVIFSIDPEKVGNKGVGGFSPKPHYMHGFKRDENGITEFIKVPHSVGMRMDPTLAKELLKRNSDYFSSDTDLDISRLKMLMKEIGIQYPPKGIGL